MRTAQTTGSCLDSIPSLSWMRYAALHYAHGLVAPGLGGLGAVLPDSEHPEDLLTSMTMTSGSTLCAVLTASTPSAASPTTSKSSSPSRASRRPFVGWSSTTITLVRRVNPLTGKNLDSTLLGTLGIPRRCKQLPSRIEVEPQMKKALPSDT